MNWKKIIFPALGLLCYSAVNAQVSVSSETPAVKTMSTSLQQKIETNFSVSPKEVSLKKNANGDICTAQKIEGVKVKLDTDGSYKALIERIVLLKD